MDERERLHRVHADVPIVVPADRTSRIQECHIAIVHVLCERVEASLFPDPEEERP